VITLDLRKLDQVLEIDETSRAARIQAGVLGPDLDQVVTTPACIPISMILWKVFVL
jgi:FAD/FMN-containing dehydrogenase